MNLSDIFSLRSELTGKSIYIENFGLSERKLFFQLLAMNVNIEGFIDEQSDYKGLKYCGKPIIATIPESDLIGIISINKINSVFLLKTNRQIIIYGAGKLGGALYDLLNFVGANVVAFADNDKLKQGKQYKGKIIVNPKEIRKQYDDAIVIIAMQEKYCQQIDIDILGNMDYFVYSCDYFEECINYEQEAFTLQPRMIYYLLHNEIRRINIAGINKDCLEYVSCALHNLGITVESVINLNCKQSEEMTIFDLMYDEEEENGIITLVVDHVEEFKSVVDKSIVGNRFIYSGYEPMLLSHDDYAFDVHLGYNTKKSIQTLCSNLSEETIRIGVLGGSTSEINRTLEKSWPECFIELANNQGISVELLCGAVGGHYSFQELIKLLRDMIPLKPDIIVSYSRVNEYASIIDGTDYAHNYQIDLFKFLSSKTEGKTVVAGSNNRNYQRNFITNIRMMKAVCEEFDIKFLSIIQPVLYDKWPFEKELWLHLGDGTGNFKYRIDKNIQDEIKKCVYDEIIEEKWCLDFSDIFDNLSFCPYYDCAHVNTEGNMIIANGILKEIINKI